MIVSPSESELTTIRKIKKLIVVVPSLNYQPTLSDVMRKLQLIHFCFESAVNQDLTKFIVLGKIMEQLKIIFTQHYDKPLNLINLLIPLCHLARISVALLFQEDFRGLGNILVSNLKVNYRF